MIRKILSTMLAMVVLIAFSGCTGAKAEGTASDAGKGETSTSEKKETAKAAGESKEVKFYGYLIDVLCGHAEKCRLDGTELTKNPEKHTLACDLSDESAASGFGLSMKDEKGVYKFFPFDADGSRLAREALEKSTRKDDLYVELIYRQQGETIHLVEINEAEPPAESGSGEGN